MFDYYEINVPSSELKKERLKAKKLKSSHQWIRKISDGICDYCGKKFLPQDLTMDHIVPIARGGKSTIGNLAAACRPCNQEKRLSTPVESILNASRKDAHSNL